MRASSVEEVGGHGPGDPWEVFTALAILVVEGRTPGGERGYHAGPHCPLPHQLQHKHSCDQNDHLCMQAGALVRQLRVMWGVGVSVSLEVLVAPECHHGAALATTLDTTTAPSQNLRLIEQWNFTIYDRRLPDAAATGWSLMAAVRSFLHFSQLSAWLSVSRGRRPPNVLCRLTVTSPVFCSKFTEEAEEHVFPIAYMGQETSIKVAVRSLPRSDKVPVVVCPEPHDEEEVEVVDESPADSCTSGYSSNKTDMTRCDDDLRRSVMKARLAENTRISRSESPDTQLGESLLDPPNSLTRFPRRYQSPSRSGSPSLETPEHLICRHRPPAPQNARPPDIGMVLGPTPPSHPFSWTQARYPMTPVVHQASADSLCPPDAEALHHHHQQHHQHHHQQQLHHQHQHPYRFDYSGPSYQQYQRPQLVYNRPHMCWPQVEPAMQHNPQHVAPHPLRNHLSASPRSYDKPRGQVSPRGGKYQHYPEYQMPEQQEYPLPTGEYPDPSPTRPVGEYQKTDPYTRLMSTRGQYPDVRAAKTRDYTPCRDQGLKRRGECSSEWECQTDHQHGKREYFKQFSSESEPCSSRVAGGSTRVKQSLDKPGGPTKEARQDLPEIMDDQLRPSCSHTGKHLCSSIEDLTEVGRKEELRPTQPHPKELKQELKNRGDVVSPGHLFRNKFNFELTPRETMEILSVLRQPTPVPPLRIDRHRNKSATESPGGSCESKTLSRYRGGGGDVGSKSWDEEEMSVNFFESREKKIEGRCWEEGKVETLRWKEREGKNGCRTDGSGEKTREVSWNDWRGKSGPGNSSVERRGRDGEKCHRENWGRATKSGVREFNPTPENLFLEAIARTGEKHCDISSCKTLVDSRESYRTRVCTDNKTGEKVNCDVKDLCGGKSARSFISQSQSRCIEAKKVTHKTNSFTANSEPTRPVTSQPQKQTSQTLVKSPFGAVLSSIKREYGRVLEDELDRDSAKLKPSKEKDAVKRALNFDDKRSVDSFAEKTSEEKNTSNGKLFGGEKFHQLEPVAQTVNRDARGVRDAREGFLKSTSLLKHLMTKTHQPPRGASQDNDGMDWNELVKKEEEEQEEEEEEEEEEEDDDKIETQEMEVQEGEMELVDNEVEKICNGKGVLIPSASEKAQFRRSLDSATNMVFHSKTGLPLTSSPAPLRKGKRFDYDSSLNTIAAIKSALYTCDNGEEHTYTIEAHDVSMATTKSTMMQLSTSAPATVTCSNLLGSFEECVLNGRLEPVSTVQGFTAEIAASGAFCPGRTTKPVTVFFYTLCDNDQISSPYMGHINLGKKGYHVPNRGTVQVTLFNPHGTVVKMFVVMYDLSDMPPNSRTFVRQRTLNMPVGASDSDPNAHQWLRYLIHLRFVSSKSSKIYLHTDVRMLIFRKSDADAATLHKTSVPYELRSFTHGPTNPKFSPRK
ncbi:uncharacterized protein LOC121862477 isoform X2 [Homarus americanus]|uniref:uncharacterized protein LOC121862477 isoform X2 n=1 Tax=Homarus americanus TaxID=6706 RepID=UPI001C47DA04|nr:uncharacterized protein LOC121862477 isoform X2 [Homarus americanus]